MEADLDEVERTNMSDRNIAVIGAGYWGKNLVRNFADLGVLHTICDADAKLLSQLASQYPQANTETEYSRVIQNEETKGIVIASPAAIHYDMAKAALLAGKDVFVEKPFTTNSQNAQELLELSEKQHRILMVGHLLLYHPAVQTLKRYIQSGELGDIYYIYSTRVNLGQVRQDENALWRLVPHDIAIYIYLLGEPPVVTSAQGSAFLQPDFVDVVFVTMSLGKVLAYVHASWLDPHKIRQLTIVGSKKMAIFDDMEPEHKLQIHDKVVDPKTLAIRSGEVAFPRLDTTEPLLLECQEFLNCIRERRQPLSDARQGLEVVRTLETAQKLMQKQSQTRELHR